MSSLNLDLGTLPVRYILVWTQGTEQRLVIVPSVNGIQSDGGPATSIRFPINPSAPAYIEAGQIRHEVVILTGFSGREERQGSTREGKEDVLPGWKLFTEFIGFLEDFSKEAAKQGGALNRLDTRLLPRLELFSTWEGVSWKIGKHTISWRHTSAEGTLAYQWTLRLETVGRADEAKKPNSPLMEADLSPDAVREGGYAPPSQYTIMRGDGQWHTNVANAANSYRKGATPDPKDLEKIPGPLSDQAEQPLESEVDRATVAMVIDDISSAGKRVQRTVDDCKRMLARVARYRQLAISAAEFPGAVFADALNVIDTATKEFDAVVDAIGPGENGLLERTVRGFEAPLLRVKRAIERALGRAGQARVQVGSSGPGGPTTSDRLTASAGERCVVRTVDAMETLPAFAQRVLGSRDLWQAIARVNGIVDPWRLGFGVPLGTGGFALLVPAQEGSVFPRDGSNDVFGECWRVDDGMQLIWRGTGFDKVRGPSAWVQAITMRFRHSLGTLASAPECGLIDIVGDSSASADLARLAVSVRSQALRDSRTSTVEQLRLSREGDTIVVQASVRPVDGKTRELTVPIVLEGMP